ncbi:hypothetical protein POPTR_014G136532v4 [Populus trichocarpa]|uniref:Uncharacterized protein n=1 Tax=Populus trichocarpa TaxID=3694 RepID=A0ACC0RZU5_POPTR|nr:hypothetical protein POPTR_014G136532v4 [Populus trichocarpa]
MPAIPLSQQDFPLLLNHNLCHPSGCGLQHSHNKLNWRKASFTGFCFWIGPQLHNHRAFILSEVLFAMYIIVEMGRLSCRRHYMRWKVMLEIWKGEEEGEEGGAAGKGEREGEEGGAAEKGEGEKRKEKAGKGEGKGCEGEGEGGGVAENGEGGKGKGKGKEREGWKGRGEGGWRLRMEKGERGRARAREGKAGKGEGRGVAAAAGKE